MFCCRESASCVPLGSGEKEEGRCEKEEAQSAREKEPQACGAGPGERAGAEEKAAQEGEAKGSKENRRQQKDRRDPGAGAESQEGGHEVLHRAAEEAVCVTLS